MATKAERKLKKLITREAAELHKAIRRGNRTKAEKIFMRYFDMLPSNVIVHYDDLDCGMRCKEAFERVMGVEADAK